MKRFFYYVSIAWEFTKMNIKRWLEYPAKLVVWMISNPLQWGFGILTLYVVVKNFGTFSDWTFGQIAFMYGLGIISHGLSVVLFIQTRYMSYSVLHGEFDRMLTRPLGVFFQFMFSEFDLVGFTDIIPACVILGIGWSLTSFVPTVVNLLNILLVLVGATLILGGINILSSSLCFWFKGIKSFTEINLRLLDYTIQYPLNIYPKAVQGLFTFLLPLAFISYYPASDLLGKDTAFQIGGNLCVWAFFIGIAVYLISMTVFKSGMKRYESAGS